MIWNIFEYAATFVEYMIYADFMLKFLKPKKKQKALLCYLLILGGIVKECAVREYPKSWIGRYQAA